MGKKVQLADGTFCYTDNCRIHDRTPISAGAATVIDDAVKDLQQRTRVQVGDLLMLAAQEGVVEDDALDYRIDEITYKLNEYMFSNSFTVADLSRELYETTYGQKVEDISTDEDREKYFKLADVATKIQNNLIMDMVMKDGDQVIVKETGMRGEIMEGSSLYGGRVRVQNAGQKTLIDEDYKWYEPHEVQKLFPSETGYARKVIGNNNRAILFPPRIVASLLKEEASVGTPNAQGLKDIEPKYHAVIKQEFEDAAERWEKGIERSVSKGRVIQFIQGEEAKRHTWLSEDEQKAVNKAYNNLLDYLQPSRSSKR